METVVSLRRARTNSERETIVATSNAEATKIFSGSQADNSANLDEPWAAGCSGIYLDVGSNVGVQLRKFFEGNLYPRSTVEKTFVKHFGSPTERGKPSKESGLCAIGFEASPEHVARLKEIEAAYVAKGWKAKFMAPVIVSNTSGQVPFYIDSGEKDGLGRGSSVLPWKGPQQSKPAKKKPMSSVMVESLDFPAFFKNEIMAVNPKKVVIKMDIEGSEYVVLPKMIESGMLCKEHLTQMSIEWHGDWFTAMANMPWKPGMVTRQDLERDMQNQKCQEGISEVGAWDDETYKSDGKPLPKIE